MKRMSLVPHQEIQKNCTNNSPAKISFRFSQTKRFKQTNPECPIAYYTFESQLSNKKASLGSGKKSDFTQDLARTPGSALYNPINFYQFTKQKGKTFGNSRQKSPPYLVPQVHQNPGPGAYQNNVLDKHSSSFTIRPKTIDVIQKHKSFKKTPGPGAYNAVELTATKQNIKVSKYKGAKLGTKVRSQRFSSVKTAPGPQTYRQIDGFSPSARFIVSSHQGRGTRPFNQQKRFTHQHWRIDSNPGSADYSKPSDFGVYGNAQFYRGLSTVL